MTEDKITKDPIIKNLFWVNLLIIAIELVPILLKRTSFPEKMPLFYSRPWGADQLVPRFFIFLVPLFSFIIFVLNFALAKILLRKEERFLACSSAGFSLVFSLLGLVSLLKIAAIII